MTGTCTCCGRIRDVQAHHPGRREHVQFTVPVCQDCHMILTIWDGGKTSERIWHTGVPAVFRVHAGLCDVIRLACIRTGTDDSDIRSVASMHKTMYTYRPSATSTAHQAVTADSDNPDGHASELRTMMNRWRLWIA